MGRNAVFLAVALVFSTVPGTAFPEVRLTLLSFNTWGSGLNEGKPIDETAAALTAADADLVGLQ